MQPERVLRLGLAVMLAAAISLPVAAWATPTDDVKNTIDRVLKIVTDPNLKPQSKTKERRAQVRQTVLERFNFGEMARRSLATHWRDLTPPQQEGVVDLF